MKAEQKLEKAFGVKVGDKVEQISSIDRYPNFLLEEHLKLTGVIELMNDGGDLMIKVDSVVKELREWDNYITYPNDENEISGFLGAFKKEFKLLI